MCRVDGVLWRTPSRYSSHDADVPNRDAPGRRTFEDLDGQCSSRRHAFVEDGVVDDVERPPFYRGGVTARALTCDTRRRAFEDAYAIDLYIILFSVGSFPIDLYRTYSHVSSEIYVNSVRARYSRPAHV